MVRLVLLCSCIPAKLRHGTGWWMIKKGGKEGWAPSNYLELIAAPKPKAAPPRPPPAKPALAAKPQMNGSVNGSASSTPMSSRPGSSTGGEYSLLSQRH